MNDDFFLSKIVLLNVFFDVCKCNLYSNECKSDNCSMSMKEYQLRSATHRADTHCKYFVIKCFPALRKQNHWRDLFKLKYYQI